MINVFDKVRITKSLSTIPVAKGSVHEVVALITICDSECVFEYLQLKGVSEKIPIDFCERIDAPVA